MEEDYCDIQEIRHGSKSASGDCVIGATAGEKELNAVMYPEGGYFNSALQNEEDYVKVV